MDSTATDNMKTEQWAVFVMGTRSLIGRLKDFEDAKTAEDIHRKLDASSAVHLHEAIDFFAPLRPVQMQGPDGKPGMGFARDPLVTMLDFTLHPVPVRIGRYDFVYLFAELHEDDRQTYEAFVKGVRRKALEMRGQKSGLVLPGAGMPSHLPLPRS